MRTSIRHGLAVPTWYAVLTVAFCLLAPLSGEGLASRAAHARDQQAQRGAAADDADESGDTSARPSDPAKDTPRRTTGSHPFPNRIPAPSLEGGVDWINTAGPIDLRALRGKFVVLDFWTYCCINCMHILPELKKLEHAYPNEIVVIGVHSAKFEAERDTENITEAVLRYEIEHPVVNDANHVIWNRYGARSWPTLVVIDPEGFIVAHDSGEIPFDVFDQFLKKHLPYYRRRGALDETPLRFDLERYSTDVTPLRYPGKVLADEASDRLYITDSNHNRIVITRLDGTLIEAIGSGQLGSADGDYASAQFNHPQGLALDGHLLYVADTENHLLRRVDLQAKKVITIAGTGRQGRGWLGLSRDGRGQPVPPDRWAGPPRRTALASPWALWVQDRMLYIAMAGPHQIWRMPLGANKIELYAGNGREDIVDGPLLPSVPYEEGYASFAQPSGLASDGTWLYVADSEGSSIRAVPFNPRGEVQTVIGTSHLPNARLFTYGDIDGAAHDARLQHALGVVYHDGLLFVADTYNHKIKVIDLENLTCTTLAGTGESGLSDEPAMFHEPAGISYAAGKLYVADTNNHRIRTIELRDPSRVATLEIPGLEPPPPPDVGRRPRFADATQVQLEPATVRPREGIVRLAIEILLPDGLKLNPNAPMPLLVEAIGDAGPIDRSQLESLKSPESPITSFALDVPITADTGSDQLKVSLGFYYCRTGAEAICKAASVTWTVPLSISETATSETLPLNFELPADLN